MRHCVFESEDIRLRSAEQFEHSGNDRIPVTVVFLFFFFFRNRKSRCQTYVIIYDVTTAAVEVGGRRTERPRYSIWIHTSNISIKRIRRSGPKPKAFVLATATDQPTSSSLGSNNRNVCITWKRKRHISSRKSDVLFRWRVRPIAHKRVICSQRQRAELIRIKFTVRDLCGTFPGVGGGGVRALITCGARLRRVWRLH